MSTINQILPGQQVWVTSYPGVSRSLVNATGIVESITGSGRAKVIFHPDCSVVRQLRVRGVIVVTSALTTVNPFVK